MHDAVKQAVSGFAIKVVAPCEGTGYEIGSMSIIKGARNIESAKNSTTGRIAEAYGGLSVDTSIQMAGAKTSPSAPDLSSINLITTSKNMAQALSASVY